MRVAGGDDKLNLNLIRKSTVRVLAIRLKEHISSVGQVKIMCRFRRDRVSILPDDILEFVRVWFRFEKSSTRWRIVRRGEIEEMEEGSTEIGRQRSKTAH